MPRGHISMYPPKVRACRRQFFLTFGVSQLEHNWREILHLGRKVSEWLFCLYGLVLRTAEKPSTRTRVLNVAHGCHLPILVAWQPENTLVRTTWLVSNERTHQNNAVLSEFCGGGQVGSMSGRPQSESSFQESPSRKDLTWSSSPSSLDLLRDPVLGHCTLIVFRPSGIYLGVDVKRTTRRRLRFQGWLAGFGLQRRALLRGGGNRRGTRHGNSNGVGTGQRDNITATPPPWTSHAHACVGVSKTPGSISVHPRARGALELAQHPTRTNWRSTVEFESASGLKAQAQVSDSDLSGSHPTSSVSCCETFALAQCPTRPLFQFSFNSNFNSPYQSISSRHGELFAPFASTQSMLWPTGTSRAPRADLASRPTAGRALLNRSPLAPIRFFHIAWLMRCSPDPPQAAVATARPCPQAGPLAIGKKTR
ncbi:hypothetical protein EDB84DRAFT_1434704 [Lactarius hengduanensis]|nr:hypothetical protein EDB84DRAFT_1434704 [Lactarius hengduanensis]